MLDVVSVLNREFMSSITVSSLGVLFRNKQTALSEQILMLCNHSEVPWVHAATHTTDMIHLFVRRNRTVLLLHNPAMGLNGVTRWPVTEHSITMR